jgi:hypothetical protein
VRILKDLTGQKFGKLTVISLDHKNSRSQPFWLCQCECGNTKLVMGGNLLSGGTKSCGCTKGKKAINLLGKKFGELEPIKRNIKRKSIQGLAFWDCLCNCGRIVTVRSDNLTSGHSKTCGCSRYSS